MQRARERLVTHATTLWTRHRLLLIIMGLGVGVLILLFTLTRAYLAIHLLLGNDLVLELQGPPASMQANQSENRTLPWSVAVTANPFCQASCTSVLRDVGTGKQIATEEFRIRTGKPYEVTYLITTPSAGIGDASYRYEVSCAARQSVLCHTNGNPVTRETTTTVTYEQPMSKRVALSQEREQLVALERQYRESHATLIATESDAQALAATQDIARLNIIVEAAKKQDRDTADALSRVPAIWATEDVDELSAMREAARPLVASLADAAANASAQASALLGAHNDAAIRMERAHAAIADAIRYPIPDSWRWNALVASISAFENAQAILTDAASTRQQRDDAQASLDAITADIARGDLYGDVAGALVVDATADTLLDALCTQELACVSHPPLVQRIEQNTTIVQSCGRIEGLRAALVALNTTLAQQAAGQIDDEALVSRARQRAFGLWRAARETARAPVATSTDTRAILVHNALAPDPSWPTQVADDANATALTGIALIALLPSCEPVSARLPTPPSVALMPLVPVNVSVAQAMWTLPDPTARCCAFGTCDACCDDTTCKSTIAPPVIFVHGHAFNGDTSAAYSLDAFDKLQRALESDGYLSYGTLDLSDASVPDGAWSRNGVPISVKASYYYDVYAGPDNAGLVQTKSENLDTYAIRLRDIVEETKRRTGQDRVVIIAHSMGGLVVRRYAQIFGEGSVSQIIMIGTPNQGITGTTADYCTFLGEEFECRDMKPGSLFLNKLEQAPALSIPIATIIGVGCDTDGSDGDGVVPAANATLAGATRLLLNGTCGGIDTLHTTMLNTDTYPQLHDYVRERLRNAEATINASGAVA